MSEPGAWSGWSRAASRSFLFAGHDWHSATGELKLKYVLDGRLLVECFRFPLPEEPWPLARPVLTDALDLLHWVAGISYWKAGCPQQLTFAGKEPTLDQAGWLNGLYREGLAEFAWHNQLPVERFEVFAGGDAEDMPAGSAGLGGGYLVPMGGGKDSLVAWSRLVRQGITPVTAQIGSAELIRDVARKAGGRHLVVERRVDPALAHLNAIGAWNGHVPITAINSAALIVLALLHGFRAVVFANERSADEPTLLDERGRPVNHQFAKTLCFERMLNAWVQRWIASDLTVFSLLRRDRELAICREFAGLERFHDVFSSCNRNFHLDGAKTRRWCGRCPKCHFVFLGLAPFMQPKAMAAIFGADLLADAQQLEGFRALLALDGRKPFECVGEAAEARAAIRALAEDPQWRDHAAVRQLATELAGLDVPSLESLCRSGGNHLIPAELLDAFV